MQHASLITGNFQFSTKASNKKATYVLIDFPLELSLTSLAITTIGLHLSIHLSRAFVGTTMSPIDATARGYIEYSNDWRVAE